MFSFDVAAGGLLPVDDTNIQYKKAIKCKIFGKI
jgi:hypothetical protein